MTLTYKELGAEVGALVDEKAKAYGRSVATAANFLELLYPDGIDPWQYEDALVLARIFEKCARRVNNPNAGESDFLDIAGHALLGLMNDRSLEAQLKDIDKEYGIADEQ